MAIPWNAALWAVAIVGAGAGLYVLHRLCLWLEERGHLFYLNRKPGSSSGSALVGLHEAFEPASRHVLVVKEEKRHSSDAEAPGADDPRWNAGKDTRSHGG